MAQEKIIEPNLSFPGGEAGMERLYIAHFEAVRRYITTHGGTETDAEDIYQEAFLALWRNVKTGKLQSIEGLNIGGYLFSIARFKWVDEIRKRKTHVKMVAEKATETIWEEQLQEDEDARIASVRKLFGKLGESCQKVLLLFYYQKKSMREIAAAMQWEEATARNNKYRCLQKLRNLMK